MKSKFILTLVFLTAFIFLVSFVSATVTQDNYGKLGILKTNGQLDTTNTDISDFSLIGFVCDNNDCSSQSGYLFTPETKTTSTNKITIELPTIKQGAGYGLFFFKEDYVPYEVFSTYAGNGQAPDGFRYLAKAESCSIPINNLVLTSQSGDLKVDFSLQSPINNGGPLNYIPTEIEEHYEVDVEYKIYSNSNLLSSNSDSLDFSQTKGYSHTFSGLSGEQEILVTASTNDAKCLTQPESSSNKSIDLSSTEPAPFITINSPQNTTYQTSSIILDIDSNGSSVWYSLNSNANMTYTNPTTITAQEGPNTLNVFANNSQNLVTSKTVAFTVNTSSSTDTTPPGQVTNLQLQSKTNSTLTWTWDNPSDSDFSHTNIYINSVLVTSTSSMSYTASGLQADTEYTISLTTEDTSGNENTNPVSRTDRTLNNSDTTDTTPPAQITDLQIDTLTNSSVEFSWDNPSDSDFSHVEIYLSGNFITNTSSESSTILGLEANTTYTISVYTVDTSGNRNNNAVTITFTTLANTSPNALSLYIESPQNTTYTNSEVRIKLNASNADSVWYNIDSGANMTYTDSFFMNFSNGTFILNAFASNSTDEISKTVTFSVNTSLSDGSGSTNPDDLSDDNSDDDSSSGGSSSKSNRDPIVLNGQNFIPLDKQTQTNITDTSPMILSGQTESSSFSIWPIIILILILLLIIAVIIILASR